MKKCRKSDFMLMRFSQFFFNARNYCNEFETSYQHNVTLFDVISAMPPKPAIIKFKTKREKKEKTNMHAKITVNTRLAMALDREPDVCLLVLEFCLLRFTTTQIPRETLFYDANPLLAFSYRANNVLSTTTSIRLTRLY